jgi:hypothetical protein
MWNNVTSPVGVLQVVNAKIAATCAANPFQLPDFSRSSALVLASDYSGEHQSSPYVVFTFIVTSGDALAVWENERQIVRHQHRLRGRRMSYTKLRDNVKSRALPAFLSAMGRFDALICSVAVNKEITSIFDASGRVDFAEWGLEAWSDWDQATFEKMLRITHTAAFLIAGMATADQNVLWVTDEDAIAANPHRLDQLTQQFAHLLDRYLTCKLRHIRCGTTAGDTGILDVEDLASIPDLVGGAFSELLAALHARGARISDRLTLAQPDNLPAKASQILSWLASRRGLRTLAYVVEPGKSKADIEVTDCLITPHTVLYTPHRLGA